MHSASFPAIGTTATVAVTDGAGLAAGIDRLRLRLAELDRTCSRFRDDSELSAVNAAAGQTVTISPLLAELVSVGLAAAEATDGLVDPLLGADMRAVGYDRTYALVRTRAGWKIERPAAISGRWRAVELDRERLRLRLPRGAELDLGATAKAWAADAAARTIAAELRAGTLVSLGGDIAVAGAPPAGGWPIGIADDHAARPEAVDTVVALASGGLATSSTTVRRWPTDGGEAHHLLSPRTGLPARSRWRTVSVVARTCLEANVAATAAVLLSDAASAWLERRGLPARLVARDSEVLVASGWPLDTAAA